ncbi:MAG: hypothetical protein AAFX93_03660 [Verrucomicrobiota bacterium]
MSTPLVIIGAGGFSLEAIWLANAMNDAGTGDWSIVGLADDGVAAGETVGGFQVLGAPREVVPTLPPDTAFHIAIGDNRVRLRVAAELIVAGLKPASLISPKAVIAEKVEIGPGSFVGHFVSLAPEVRIGAQCLINVSAVVGHEAVLADGVQVCPGAVVTGRCQAGEGAFVGSNAVLSPEVTIGAWSRVSANTFAATNVDDGVTLATMPGRPVFSRRRERKPSTTD